jgi:hypothetical protein
VALGTIGQDAAGVDLAVGRYLHDDGGQISRLLAGIQIIEQGVG